MTELMRETDGEGDMWASKPPWCQPWTIVGTGSCIVYAPILIFHAKWLAALVSLPIAAWWWGYMHSTGARHHILPCALHARVP
jgi:hypothetical protein